ncbi:MAG: serine hydroxymethyltransferase [Clostridiales bacterium]|jgi:glycine hydroxymethyltransferase|nr:serine hydroxymethyltransferase [Clostridiales bacterium]
MFFDELRNYDREVWEICSRELTRQRENIELIASENIVSKAVLLAASGVLTNKYAEGTIAHRYYGGCNNADAIEDLAVKRAKALFGAEHVNVQPHSGANANMAAFYALLEPGDTYLGMSLSEGGHLSHGSPVNISGKYFNAVSYGLLSGTETIDYDEVRDLARRYRPKIIVAGASAYPRTIDFELFRQIADETGAVLLVDMAHIAGLVAAGVHPSPVPWADVVTTTTHKTLRGPRGGMILCRQEYAKRIDKAVFPGTQGGPLMHIIAAKAVALGEAMTEDFAEYQRRTVRNARYLGQELVRRGFRLVSGGTDNHLMLVDLRNFALTGRDFERNLDEVHITLNKNAIPDDPQKAFVTSGVRIGTPSVTTRGFREEEMGQIAQMLYDAASDFEGQKTSVTERVRALCEKYPLYEE